MTRISTISQLVNHDQCIGCGACTVGTESESKIALNHEGFYGFITNDLTHYDQQVCPFLAEKNEDSIASDLYNELEYKEGIGFYGKIWAGYVNEGSFRKQGTSGGMGSWVPAMLIRKKLVDAILHIKSAGFDSHPYYEYAVSCTEESVLEGVQSRYYPAKFDDVINEVLATELKYCFVGLPCHVKAIRLLQDKYPLLKQRIVFVISIVCGHMKSAWWTDMLSWSGGINPKDLSYFQHRTKVDSPSFQIRHYISTAVNKVGFEKVFDTASIPGGKFNSCAFMANACNFCDDIVGETSDIVLGDAWLPRFETDKRGTNLIIVRNKLLEELLESSSLGGLIQLKPITSDDACWAQAGGIRQRREGLAYRLHIRAKRRQPNPRKRVQPNGHISVIRKVIYRLRLSVQRRSLTLFNHAVESNQIYRYYLGIYPFIILLRFIEVISSLPRIARRRLGWLKINLL
jgi:coenzyme F420-reducing hydrogenase beta subunit